MVLVTLFSLFSFSGVDSSGFKIPHLDKAVHFTFYFVMVVLAFLANGKEKSQGRGSANLLWYIVLFAISYGIMIEVLQHVATVDRYGDPFDALANSVGAITGMLLIRYVFLRERSLK